MCPNVELKGPSDPAKQLKIIDFSEPGSFATPSKTLKSISAVHLFNLFPALKSRKFWGSGFWSRSTYYPTVGHIAEETVRTYIEMQKERG